MVQDQMQQGYLTEIYIYICSYRMSGQEQEAWNKPHDRSNWQERTWHHNDPGTLTNEQTGLSEGDNTRWHEWDWLPWKRRTEVSVITPINPNKQTEGKEGRQTSQLGLILIIINKLIGNTLRLLYMDLKFWKNLPLEILSHSPPELHCLTHRFSCLFWLATQLCIVTGIIQKQQLKALRVFIHPCGRIRFFRDWKV